jgi:hypothetical protein
VNWRYSRYVRNLSVPWMVIKPVGKPIWFVNGKLCWWLILWDWGPLVNDVVIAMWFWKLWKSILVKYLLIVMLSSICCNKVWDMVLRRQLLNIYIDTRTVLYTTFYDSQLNLFNGGNLLCYALKFEKLLCIMKMIWQNCTPIAQGLTEIYFSYHFTHLFVRLKVWWRLLLNWRTYFC